MPSAEAPSGHHDPDHIFFKFMSPEHKPLNVLAAKLRSLLNAEVEANLSKGGEVMMGPCSTVGLIPQDRDVS